MIDRNRILVWPLVVERGALGTADSIAGGSCRVPLHAFVWCHANHPHLKLNEPTLAFADRGQEFLRMLT